MSLVDVVLFDISSRSDNIGWELEQLAQVGGAERVIFIARKRDVEEAAKFLSLKGVNAEVGKNLFAYDEEGMALVERFMTRFAFLLTGGPRRVAAHTARAL